MQNICSLPRSERPLVVVDGGGSGSRFALIDAAGQRQVEYQGGPASLSLGVEPAVHQVRVGLKHLQAESGVAGFSRIVCGLAGGLRADRVDAFAERLCAIAPTRVVNDGVAQLLGVAGGKPAVCLAVGTGSVVDWLDHTGHFGHAGGWGYPVGDEASGAWLGRRALNAYLWWLDEQHTAPSDCALMHALNLKLGSDPLTLTAWSTSRKARRLATLAPDIVQAAQQGNPLSSALLDEGAAALLRLVALGPSDLPVYLAGGLAAAYHGRLSTVLGERLCAAQGDALDGLVLLDRQFGPDRAARVPSD